MAFDYESLTLGEVAYIEDYSGQGIAAIANEDAPKGKSMIALATVIKRRSGFPGFNPADAENLKMSEVNALFSSGDDDEDEPDPKGS